jgi:hypothetical protein
MVMNYPQPPTARKIDFNADILPILKNPAFNATDRKIPKEIID